jgi:hypothetical protein
MFLRQFDLGDETLISFLILLAVFLIAEFDKF